MAELTRIWDEISRYVAEIMSLWDKKKVEKKMYWTFSTFRLSVRFKDVFGSNK